jgi:hypothetical protein
VIPDFWCNRLITTAIKQLQQSSEAFNVIKVKPQYWVALIGAAIALSFVLVHIFGIAWRNAQYHRTLKGYSDVLKPGMKRSDVETYFIMSRHVSFSQAEGSRGAFDDIVAIAHEKEGWVCQEQVVYVVFQFAAVQPERELAADPEDRLAGTSLDRSVCLDLP